MRHLLAPAALALAATLAAPAPAVGGTRQPRLLGAAMTGLAGLLISVGATNDGALTSLIAGALAFSPRNTVESGVDEVISAFETGIFPSIPAPAKVRPKAGQTEVGAAA